EAKAEGKAGPAGGEEYELSVYERVNYIVFIIHCFQSLENPLVRACVLPLVSLPLWHALSPARRERELHPHAHLQGLWERLLKRDAKNRAARLAAVAEGGGRRAEAEAAERRDRRSVRFLPGLILEFFAVLDEVVEKGPDYEDDQSESAGVLLERAVDQPRLLFCERFLELLIDLLSQLPTRRFFRPVVDDMAVAARCRLSRLYRHPRGRLFVQLVDLLRFYARFQMDDHAGRQLDEEEVDREHCARVSALQLFLFNKVPELRDVALTNVGSVEHADGVRKWMARLTDEQLAELVLNKLKLLSRAGLPYRPPRRLLSSIHRPKPPKADDMAGGEQQRMAVEGEEEEEKEWEREREREEEEQECWSQERAVLFHRLRPFLEEVVVTFFEKRRSQQAALNALPLYPNEDVMWDESLIPSVNYTGEGCLALPKLNLQFLTLHDYLLRNFNLFRLESTYEIREEVHDVLKRMGARGSMYGSVERDTEFTGWARMAIQISSFRIVEVKAPLLGEVQPAAVLAEVEYSIGGYKAAMRSEWEEIKEHDVLFLLGIHPDEIALQAAADAAAAQAAAQAKRESGEDGAEEEEAAADAAAVVSSLSIPQRYGLRYVRGCEVIELRDEDNKLMNDFSGRVKREEWKPPKGNKRTALVALDPAQFQLDLEANGGTLRGAQNEVYSALNVVMRRKPKENNFKPILESIRDLMNEEASVPAWLHDLFLGYDDPAAASWRRMPAELVPWRLEVVDFRDTFVDAEHLKECFPGHKVRFVDADGFENPDPQPPFRVTIPMPKLQEESRGAAGGKKKGQAAADKGKGKGKGKKGAKGKKKGKGKGGEDEKGGENEVGEQMEVDGDKGREGNGGEGAPQQLPQGEQREQGEQQEGKKEEEAGEESVVIAESVPLPDPGPYPPGKQKKNHVRFTPTQLDAIISGVQPGLTMIVGPPGTGKTDTAVQILQVLYHNCPDQRTLVITHSNQALNDLFEKIMERDVPARYMLRLGMGEQELSTEQKFSRMGRVNDMLARRLELLAEVERLAVTLGRPSDMAYTCESAAYFWLLHVLARWEAFVAKCESVRDAAPSETTPAAPPAADAAATDAAAAAAATDAAAAAAASPSAADGAAAAAAEAAEKATGDVSMQDAAAPTAGADSAAGAAATSGSGGGGASAPAASGAAAAAAAASGGGSTAASIVRDTFPFTEFFQEAPGFKMTGGSYAQDMRTAESCFEYLKGMFEELEECRAFELFKTTADRSNYLMARQAKVVAMTCTHAALKRRDFLNLGFHFDNLLMEESAQILEIETFIPMLLQRPDGPTRTVGGSSSGSGNGGSGAADAAGGGRQGGNSLSYSRLKRCILIGDHNQLPPVVKNMAFQKYSRMDQSLFTRFVRLGVPYIELNAQGRARPSIAQLYNWRYRDLGDLPVVKTREEYVQANGGFAWEYQLVDVGDWMGRGESEPNPWFYQNLGEAEYVVSVFQYMRLMGYPAEKISILTTYNGQKHLIRDVIERRCAANPRFGRPSKVTTVDRFQGQQNDYILLSLVRTRTVGHLRDVRRLVVAMSRARLGLYCFCRRSLFEQCYELQPTFQLLLQRPDRLGLVLEERSARTGRRAGEGGEGAYLVEGIEEMARLVEWRLQIVTQQEYILQNVPGGQQEAAFAQQQQVWMQQIQQMKHAQAHAQAQMQAQPQMHGQPHAQPHVHMPAHSPMHMHAHMQAQMQMQMQQAQAHAQAQVQQAQAVAHAYAQAHAHTQAQLQVQEQAREMERRAHMEALARLQQQQRLQRRQNRSGRGRGEEVKEEGGEEEEEDEEWGEGEGMEGVEEQVRVKEELLEANASAAPAAAVTRGPPPAAPAGLMPPAAAAAAPASTAEGEPAATRGPPPAAPAGLMPPAAAVAEAAAPAEAPAVAPAAPAVAPAVASAAPAVAAAVAAPAAAPATPAAPPAVEAAAPATTVAPAAPAAAAGVSESVRVKTELLEQAREEPAAEERAGEEEQAAEEQRVKEELLEEAENEAAQQHVGVKEEPAEPGAATPPGGSSDSE
ncbi:hypothetical protein CLOM_g3581, partial [Closterium sp. NIES-68]